MTQEGGSAEMLPSLPGVPVQAMLKPVGKKQAEMNRF